MLTFDYFMNFYRAGYATITSSAIIMITSSAIN